MGKNVIMILAVIVTVLAGWLVIQVASSTNAPGASTNIRAAIHTARGGDRVEVQTTLSIPSKEVDTTLNIR